MKEKYSCCELTIGFTFDSRGIRKNGAICNTLWHLVDRVLISVWRQELREWSQTWNGPIVYTS
jgi:hypothetical protein